MKYKAAAIQYEPTQLKKEYNISSLLKFCEDAAKAGSKLIVTPEMGTTGYCFLDREEIKPLVESIPGPTTDKFYEIGFKETLKIIKDVLGDTPTYFTFDIDGIDPTFAPGTGTPEVGGINVREAQLVIRELKDLNFIGADVVEVSPPFDLNNMTSLVGATIAFEILCTMTKTN